MTAGGGGASRAREACGLDLPRSGAGAAPAMPTSAEPSSRRVCTLECCGARAEAEAIRRAVKRAILLVRSDVLDDRGLRRDRGMRCAGLAGVDDALRLARDFVAAGS